MHEHGIRKVLIHIQNPDRERRKITIIGSFCHSRTPNTMISITVPGPPGGKTPDPKRLRRNMIPRLKQDNFLSIRHKNLINLSILSEKRTLSYDYRQ